MESLDRLSQAYKEAMKIISKLIATDIFPRFRKSNEYLEYCGAMRNSGRNLGTVWERMQLSLERGFSKCMPAVDYCADYYWQALVGGELSWLMWINSFDCCTQSILVLGWIWKCSLMKNWIKLCLLFYIWKLYLKKPRGECESINYICNFIFILSVESFLGWSTKDSSCGGTALDYSIGKNGWGIKKLYSSLRTRISSLVVTANLGLLQKLGFTLQRRGTY